MWHFGGDFACGSAVEPQGGADTTIFLVAEKHENRVIIFLKKNLHIFSEHIKFTKVITAQNDPTLKFS